jgi:hypothetical protein
MLSGFALLICLKINFNKEVIFKNKKFKSYIVGFILIFLLASFTGMSSVANDKDDHRKSRLIVKEYLENKITNPILIVPNYFGSSAKEYALYFSSIWSGKYKDDFIQNLNSIYPYRYFFFPLQNKFFDWQCETSLFDILKKHSSLNVYVSLDATEKSEVDFEKEIKEKINVYNFENNSVIKLSTIVKTRFDWICELKIDTAKLASYFQYEAVVCDMEQISEDNLYYVSKKDSFFTNNNHRIKGKSFAGNYIEKLDKQNPWGVCCTLDSLKKGNYYETSVWVKNEDNKCYVIASSEDYKTLYISSNSIAEVKNGWKKIKVSFVADEKTENSSVKFFVWYQGENLSFVDDFMLKIGKRQ